jgi:type IV pilus assembly protein PilB
MSFDPNLNPLQDINAEFEEREAQELAIKLGLEYINIAKFPLNPDVLVKIGDEQKSRDFMVIPFFKNLNKIKIAVVNPENPETKNYIKELKQTFKVTVFICTKSGFDKVIDLFHSKFLNQEHVETRTKFKESEKVAFSDSAEVFKKLGEIIKNLPIETAIAEIEIAAVQAKASDIHIQPTLTGVVLRFRIDGILHNVCEILLDKAKKIINRIKYDSGMMSNISDIPQDGHLSFEANNRTIDLRVSSLPTQTTESIVMRILDSRKGIRKFADLGFEDDLEQKIQKAIHHKNGMVLVTGPTGSGKTTTLYSMLSELNSSDRKLVSLEDPIEYHLDNVTQSQINPNKDYTFATGLKALLRHDPDVILIGEIREFSTAKLATEASLTGHVVFSSLHTNSAVGAITRLQNLGLENYNISSSINAIFAQRLVRKRCTNCGKKELINISKNPRIFEACKHLVKKYPNFANKISKQGNDYFLADIVPQGCIECSNIGYQGQQAICEAVIFSDNLRRMIANGASELDLFVELQKDFSFNTLLEHGLIAVLKGETTLKEIIRVVG